MKAIMEGGGRRREKKKERGVKEIQQIQYWLFQRTLRRSIQKGPSPNDF